MKMKPTNYKDMPLSLRAQGILAHIERRGGVEGFTQGELYKISSDGQTSIMSGMRELADKGYLRKSRKTGKGRKGYPGWDYQLLKPAHSSITKRAPATT